MSAERSLKYTITNTVATAANRSPPDGAVLKLAIAAAEKNQLQWRHANVQSI